MFRSARGLSSATDARRRGDVRGLIAMLSSAHAEDRAEAATALGRLRCPVKAVDALSRAAMSDPIPAVRRESVRALGARTPGETEVCATLVQCLRDTDRDTRISAAAGLGRVGCRDASAIAGLCELSTHRDTWTRIYAVRALADVRHRSTVPALVRGAGDEDRRVFNESVRGLRTIADAGDRATLEGLAASLTWTRRLRLSRIVRSLATK